MNRACLHTVCWHYGFIQVTGGLLVREARSTKMIHPHTRSSSPCLLLSKVYQWHNKNFPAFCLGVIHTHFEGDYWWKCPALKMHCVRGYRLLALARKTDKCVSALTNNHEPWMDIKIMRLQMQDDKTSFLWGPTLVELDESEITDSTEILENNKNPVSY